jgi:ribosomal protein S18 acetylase RimI-like enzyme
MPNLVAGTDAVVAACVELWIRALTWRDGAAPVDGVAARTSGKFGHQPIRFTIVPGDDDPMAFALTNRLSDSSAEAGERAALDAAYTAYIELLAVDPGTTSHGLGRALLRDAVESAVTSSCRQIMLHVRIDNAAAIHLYESEGFEMVGEPHEHELGGAPMIEMRRRLAR